MRNYSGRPIEGYPDCRLRLNWFHDITGGILHTASIYCAGYQVAHQIRSTAEAAEKAALEELKGKCLRIGRRAV
jgi:hypothetical protein